MARTSQRLWEKGIDFDQVIHRFTVSDDPLWDQYLLHWDCLGSAAHAMTLHRANLLSQSELDHLLSNLADIDKLAADGEFEIPVELEDCHTAIEAYLTEKHSDSGSKIHAGRSRNDQVATAMRLFMRYHAVVLVDLLNQLLDALIARIEADGNTPMPGYTHMQPAMPSSVGQWLQSFAEAVYEQMHAAEDLLSRFDSCPLGTGAGYGVPLPLDRDFSAKLLGFSRVQRSAIDVQNSRGRLEKYFVRVAADIGSLVEKLCYDLLLFSTAEFDFFTLPDAMTTGSSIMPQKKNPDVLELLRGYGARLRARMFELEHITAKLPSGYNRDLQLTKEPTVRSALELATILPIVTQVVSEFGINEGALHVAMRPILYATHAALEMTTKGLPFRAAYRKIAERVLDGKFNEQEAAPYRLTAGRIDSRFITELKLEQEALLQRAEQVKSRISKAENSLLGTGVQCGVD